MADVCAIEWVPTEQWRDHNIDRTQRRDTSISLASELLYPKARYVSQMQTPYYAFIERMETAVRLFHATFPQRALHLWSHEIGNVRRECALPLAAMKGLSHDEGYGGHLVSFRRKTVFRKYSAAVNIKKS